jgi:drug/metabolite transporter (DMT)-like permease
VIALGIVATLIGHTLVLRASRHVAPSTVALVSPGETVGSIAIGAIAQGAWPTSDEWIGVALVVTGATLAVTGSLQTRADVVAPSP